MIDRLKPTVYFRIREEKEAKPYSSFNNIYLKITSKLTPNYVYLLRGGINYEKDISITIIIVIWNYFCGM